ncbi:DUF2218 domain-containing protein [Sphaerisporangium flaviroseum]|uniref:DUF2218 domain-containing protein n=1 Tax=Sphaerisporangium flaviroseum TaxID=509199 RepID=A0ABP7ITQ5_9ACTN
MPSSTARVATDAAGRYAKQLASHLGRRIQVRDRPGGGFHLTLQAGEGVLVPEPTRLVMHATAPDPETLATVQDVLGSHLERFGRRNELIVTWEDDE